MAVWPIISGAAAVLAGTASWAACHPRSQLFGPTLSRLRSESILALTFDDGPNPSATAAILDVLERHRASATFFLIGGFARACPSLVKAIAERGHSIGNHTDSHPNTLWLSTRALVTELVSCQDAIDEITGKRPLLMRPPFGFRGPHLYAAVKRSGLNGWSCGTSWVGIGRGAESATSWIGSAARAAVILWSSTTDITERSEPTDPKPFGPSSTGCPDGGTPACSASRSTESLMIE